MSSRHAPKGNGLLPKELAASWTQIGMIMAVVGVIAFVAGLFGGGDKVRFGAAYLTGFMFTTTIAIGALFLVVIQHLTKAGWSVGPRRILEWVSQALVASVVLFIPVLLLAPDLFSHWMGPHAAHDVGVAGARARGVATHRRRAGVARRASRRSRRSSSRARTRNSR